MATYRIYQLVLQDGVPFPEWTFRDAEYAFSHGLEQAAYEPVYELEAADGAFEQLFEKFNVDYPADYNGRSMSVSDVIVCDGRPYYVDSFGFAEVPPELWQETV